MRIVLGEDNGTVIPGVLTDEGVIDIGEIIPEIADGQASILYLIDHFEELVSDIARCTSTKPPIPLSNIRLRAPIPRPGKILCCIGNYWEHAQREPKELDMFLKNPDAVIGPDDTIHLPTSTEPWMFMHEAELALVIRGPVKDVAESDWRRAVFGYTCLIDVSARGEGRSTWKRGSWLGKSFDTFCPIGPCIATADEGHDPNDLHVQLWVDDQLRHNYSTDDMEHRVPEVVRFASGIMTLRTGDLLSCGTNHEGLGPLQHGEVVSISIENVGNMSLKVEDPLRRSWEKAVYMGADSTNPDAIRRHRPAT